MNVLQIFLLAVVQGFAELLPVSSSAHVIVAERLMGLDPTAPEMTLLLVMLHTGTMLAVILYFWRRWRKTYLRSEGAFRSNAKLLIVATVATGVTGVALLQAIKYGVMRANPAFEIEDLFGNSILMATALAAAGVLIIVSSRIKENPLGEISVTKAVWIGAVQGLCLPFRGFSRSGATISTGMLLGAARHRCEEFSFALAVLLTPPVVAKEAYRFYKAQSGLGLEYKTSLLHLLGPSLLGMGLSFVAGLVALRWLSGWLDHGRWHFFGLYCLVAAVVVLVIR